MTILHRAVRSLFPQGRQEPANLQSWREQTLRLISAILVVLFVPLFSIHLYGSLQREEHLKVAFELVVCLFTFGIAFVSWLPYRARAGAVLCMWYLLGAELTFALGLVGSGRIFLCAAPILTALLLGRRAAVVGWAGAMVVLLTLLGASAAGLAGLPLNPDVRASDTNVLVVNSFVLVVVSGVTVVAAISLTSRLSSSLRTAEEANAALSLMLRMLPDLVWFKDAAGRYKFASDVFFSFHGRSREESINRTAEELFPPAYAAAIARGDRCTIEGGRRYYNEGLVPSSEGRSIWLDTIKTPVYDDAGRLLGILGTSHDITARKQAEETLARQARYAQALAQSAQLLLSRGESQWGRVAEAIEQLRAATGVSRFFVYAHHLTPNTPASLVAETHGPESRTYRASRLPWDEIPPGLVSALNERRWFGGPTAGRWPDYPRFQAIYDDNGIKSTLVVPIYVDARLWGHMGISDREQPREWDEATIQLLFTAAEMLAASIVSWEGAQALIERTAAAEAADRAKSDFLATVSHEIRTPLNAIVGTAELLAESSLAPEQRGMADLIRGGGEALLEIINNILDFSKIEAGRVDLEQRPFELRGCLEEALSMVARAAAQKQIELVLVADPALPPSVVGDVARVRGVLLNLLANAVKFTERGTITLVAHREHGGPGVVRFEVSDTGIGIPESRLGNIFEPFTQADSSTTRRYGGTGLGLAICRQLVALMGGRIEVRSAVSVGSTFTVLLPLPEAEASDSSQPVAPDAPAEPATPARALRVLVAEDNSVNQEVTRLMLARLGYSADVVGDGAAAVAAVAERPYDLVLMDVQMPEVDGVEATRRIRALRGLARQPHIVALTANALYQDRERYLAAGMDDYLSKPVRVAGLRAALAGVVVPESPPEPPADLVDWRAFEAQIEALGGNAAATALVLQLMSEEIAAQLQQLDAVVVAGDRHALVARAHKLRGGSGQLGAHSLALGCAALERDGGTAPLDELTARMISLRACHGATLEAMRRREAVDTAS